VVAVSLDLLQERVDHTKERHPLDDPK
jgi:hypothetical protein